MGRIVTRKKGIEVVNFKDRAGELAVRFGGVNRKGIGLHGHHEAYAVDKRGRLKWHSPIENLVTTAGANYLIGAGFTAVSPITTWYIGMVVANRVVNDGAITATLFVLTSATASFVGGDVGRLITVVGAGAAGANLVTTIASVTNGTTVVLTAAAGTTVTGATTVIGPLFVIGDTAASHAGWTEIPGADVTNSVRPTWTPGSVVGGSVDDSGSPAVYTIASGLVGTLWICGLFMISNNTLGGSTGTLYSEGGFSAGAQPVAANYGISDTYTVSGTPG